jgi:Malectin domain
MALTQTSAALEVIFAVNAADQAYHDPISGISYEADSNSEGGNFTWLANVKFGGLDTSKQAVYRAVRSDPENFGCDLPITEDGDYALLLHFSDD